MVSEPKSSAPRPKLTTTASEETGAVVRAATTAALQNCRSEVRAIFPPQADFQEKSARRTLARSQKLGIAAAKRQEDREEIAENRERRFHSRRCDIPADEQPMRPFWGRHYGASSRYQAIPNVRRRQKFFATLCSLEEGISSRLVRSCSHRAEELTIS